MFVVHSVNQLEEALNGSAKEILVTGDLFGPVKAAFPAISGKNDKSLTAGTSAAETPDESGARVETNEVPGLESSLIQLLTENFTFSDIQDSPCCPSIKLRRKNKA